MTYIALEATLYCCFDFFSLSLGNGILAVYIYKVSFSSILAALLHTARDPGRTGGPTAGGGCSQLLKEFLTCHKNYTPEIQCTPTAPLVFLLLTELKVKLVQQWGVDHKVYNCTLSLDLSELRRQVLCLVQDSFFIVHEFMME